VDVEDRLSERAQAGDLDGQMAPDAQRVFEAVRLLREHDNEHPGRYRNLPDDEE
jgi:hypothetical protein